jgi:creatinine amidohydrolase
MSTNASRRHCLLELTREQAASLRKDKTLVVLPSGTIEQHGPHLPVGTDCFMAESVSDQVISNFLNARPQWEVVLFPTLEWGTQSIEELALSKPMAGSVTVSTATLRRTLIDIGMSLAGTGYLWVAVIHRHGSPLHSQALHEAAAFVRDKTGIGMFCLRFATSQSILEKANALAGRPFSRVELEEIVLEVHAGCVETSCVLHTHPSLVDSAYRKATPIPLTSLDEMYEKSRSPNWPGYFGFPARASASFGEALIAVAAIELTSLILESVDHCYYPRAEGVDSPLQREVDYYRLAHEETIDRQLDSWLLEERDKEVRK